MSRHSKIILNSEQLTYTINRLSFQLIENHNNFDQTVIIGMQSRGILLAQKIHKVIQSNIENKIPFGYLDTTFFRDDFRRRSDVIIPKYTKIDFSLEGASVILIDDVLFTGRSVRAALDALVSFGRPSIIELLVLIERRFSRELPIQPKYIGKSVDVIDDEYVNVNLEGENSSVYLVNNQK